MIKPKVLILRTAGTNCDYETVHAFQLAEAETALIHINQLIAGKTRLMDYQMMAVPGGFSYGDDIAAGILLANEMKHKLADQITEFVEAGKLIIGICNGFQALVRAGLLPGLKRETREQGSEEARKRESEKAGKRESEWTSELLTHSLTDSPTHHSTTHHSPLTTHHSPLTPQQATLAMNASAKFECRWIYLQTQESPCVFTQGLKSRIYLPVAHAEGRFTAPEGTLNQIEANRQVVFRYASANGEVPEYPANPNGSDHDIAGICDPTGRIFGMMPHPERFLTRFNHPRWTREDLPEEGDGLALFRNAVDYARRN